MADNSKGSFLTTYGLQEALYSKITPAIRHNNHVTLKVALIVCVAMFSLMSVLRFADVISGSALSTYILAAFLSAGALVTEIALYDHFKVTKCSTVIFYLFLVIVVGYAMVVSVIDAPTGQSVTICLLMCIGPSIMLDRPWRTLVAMLVIFAVFCGFAGTHKALSVFIVDLTNMTTALALGLAVGVNTQRMRVNSFAEDYAKSRAAKMDGLTGILNKSAFENEAACLIDAGITGALLVIDADNFKHVNDTYGHATGDEVIKAIGTSIDMNRRGSDLMGRFGGDEFCVLLVGNIPPETPQNYYTRLLATFQEQTADIKKAEGQPLTLSCGAALLEPHSLDYAGAFAAADAALYRAKRTRNTIVVA